METRRQVLEHLIAFRHPLDRIQAALVTFPTDSPTEFVFLTSGDISRILRRYLDGALDGDQVEDWANMLEGRDDVGFEEPQELVKETLHELANPLLTQPLTPERSLKLLLTLDP